MAWPRDIPYPVTNWTEFWQQFELGWYYLAWGSGSIRQGKTYIGGQQLRVGFDFCISCVGFIAQQISESSTMSDEEIMQAFFRAVMHRPGT